MALTYRQMIVQDLPAVLAVRFATRENTITRAELEQDYGITEASLAEAMATHVGGWLCEADGRVLGFAMGDRDNGEVQVVALRPEAERRGIGKALLARVCAWLFEAGHDPLWLRANPDPAVRAHGFYRRLGWHPTGERRGADEVLVLDKADAPGDA